MKILLNILQRINIILLGTREIDCSYVYLCLFIDLFMFS